MWTKVTKFEQFPFIRRNNPRKEKKIMDTSIFFDSFLTKDHILSPFGFGVTPAFKICTSVIPVLRTHPLLHSEQYFGFPGTIIINK